MPVHHACGRQASRMATAFRCWARVVATVGTDYAIHRWVGTAGPPRPSNDPTVMNAIKQLEQDMGDALARVDIDKLNQIYADDFMTFVLSGTVITKKDLLRNFGSLHDKAESFENGPVDVQVFGNVAVAYGSVSEKRLRDGKDSSGEFVGSISWRIETANGWRS